MAYLQTDDGKKQFQEGLSAMIDMAQLESQVSKIIGNYMNQPGEKRYCRVVGSAVLATKARLRIKTESGLVVFAQIKPAKINLSLFGRFLERLFGL